MRNLFFFSLIIGMFSSGCAIKKLETTIVKYVPDDQELYQNIVKMDSIFFGAYNRCDLDKQSSILSDDLEFYHDKGGLMTSKQDVMDGIAKNICGKVTRELVAGSIEVYPINNFGAIQMGLHRFYNNQEPVGTPSKAGKFITIWKNESGNWKITRVISLH